MSDYIPQIDRVQIVLAAAEGIDQKRLQLANVNREQPVPAGVYLVKIYLKEAAPVTGQAAALYVGDEWVRKYTAFGSGIFFNVYDEQFFRQHDDDPIRFTFDHEAFHDTGFRLSRPAASSLALGLTDASDELPSKTDALNE